jgi:hypothetical protein
MSVRTDISGHLHLETPAGALDGLDDELSA